MTLGIPWQVANVALGILALAAFMVSSVRRATARSVSAAAALLRREWGALAIVVVAVAFQAWMVVLLPELSIDGQLYHGPALAQLVQQGTVWGWQAPNQYMFYSDLAMVAALNIATFTGTTWFDNGAQVVHLVLLLLVINVALRVRFARAWVRLSLALLIVSAPVIWIQARILYVDIAYGAAVAALIVLIVMNRRAAGVDVLFAAIAGASILAIKPTGLTTSAVLLSVLIVVSVWRRHRAGKPWGPAIGVALAAVAGPALLACGFYIRNLMTFGNPVYPVQVTVGPISLPGIVDLSVFASGDRGSGIVDPVRWATYLASLAHGMRHGVTKLDYDPREGGFGQMPTMVIALTLIILIAQVAFALARSRARRMPLAWRGNLRMQAGLTVLALAVLLVQPSTFDARYVMGPTAVLAAAALLTTLVPMGIRFIDASAGVVALTLALGQIVWVEMNVYPGVAALRELRILPEMWQPVTPGNPWGRGANVSWLPDDAGSCSRVVLQTEGGVGASGMMERAALSTLPYGLYGESLCNIVTPVQLGAQTAGTARSDPLLTADFLIFYDRDLERWEALMSEGAACWTPLISIEATENYPEAVTVLQDTCD
ncbi:hypothetical protein ASD56_00035 [Microbacterium sp. Root166]|nr:hypothetical protein ASD56_00035 [Microbacterium sp. Root166]